MTTTQATPTTMTDDQLVYEIAGLKQTIATCRDTLQRLEFELQQRLEAKGATSLPNEFYDVKLEKTYILSVEELKAHVGELIPPGEWAKAVTEEHEETTTITVAAKADARVVNTWKKYGSEVAAGIEAARIPNATRLTVKERK